MRRFDNQEPVYKVVPADAWAAAVGRGAYHGSADDLRDGFIHLSTGGQLAGTLSKHFRNVGGLLLVAFEAGALGPALQWEPSRGGALFPHLNAPLPTAAALWSLPLALGEDGIHKLPEGIATC